MKSQDNPIYSPVVIDMVTVSAEYCLFLEKLSLSGTTRRKFLEQITRLLPLIYVKASLLPRLDDSGYFDLPITVSEDDYEEVRQMVWRLLKGDDEYLEVFTPDMQYSEGAMTHTISEDLADIYGGFCRSQRRGHERCHREGSRKFLQLLGTVPRECDATTSRFVIY